MKITIVDYELEKYNDISAWTFDIDGNDYWKIIEKYLHDGTTTRGTKEKVFAELMED